MSLPLIPNIPRMQDYTQEFKGYNHNLRIAENEFYDENNLSADNYPVLSTRKGRHTKSYNGEILGAVCRADEFWCVVNESDAAVLYNNDTPMELKNGDEELTLSIEKKQMLFFGANLLIFPDSISFNVIDNRAEYIVDYFPRSIDCTVQLQVNTNYGKGTPEYENIETVRLATEDELLYADKGDLWEYDYVAVLDESKFSGLKKITLGEVEGDFTVQKYDRRQFRLKIYIKKEDLLEHDLNILFDLSMFQIRYTSIKTEKVLLSKSEEDSEFYIFYVDDTVIPYAEICYRESKAYYYSPVDVTELSVHKDQTGEYKESALFETSDFVAVKRLVKDFMLWDYITECQNRLWACRHGENAFGEMVNEIYATKLGTFNEWHIFDKTASDSYVASLGTPGNFTGVSVINQNPVFFKEDYIHKVYVSSTGAHQIVVLEVPGPEENSSKSITHVNGNVIYKTRNDVVLFDGTAISSISYALGNEHYMNAVAGASRNKYVMFCQDNDQNKYIFTYDISLGIWHKENAPDVAITDMVLCDGKLHMVTNKDVYVHDDDSSHEKVPFMFESGEIGFGMPDKKYVSRIDLRLSLEMGTRMKILMQYDSDGVWVRAGDLYGTEKIPKPISIPILPRRCDHFKMRVSGEGKFNLYSITKILEQGE